MPACSQQPVGGGWWVRGEYGEFRTPEGRSTTGHPAVGERFSTDQFHRFPPFGLVKRLATVVAYRRNRLDSITISGN